eukprot:5346898-Ditylum_brightwellii.AAC.2
MALLPKSNKKSLKYLLVATSLIEDECKRIESPTLKVALQCSDMPSDFPHSILYKPHKYLGLNAPCLFTTCGLKHSNTLMEFGDTDTITGKHMRAIVERHKVELGCPTSLLETKHNIHGKCTITMWMALIWKFMEENNLLLKETTLNLTLARINNKFLVEEFAWNGILGTQLETFNQCRLFFNVTTLADICTGDEKSILPLYLMKEKLIPLLNTDGHPKEYYPS